MYDLLQHCSRGEKRNEKKNCRRRL
jgi:hypothetical protein